MFKLELSPRKLLWGKTPTFAFWAGWWKCLDIYHVHLIYQIDNSRDSVFVFVFTLKTLKLIISCIKINNVSFWYRLAYWYYFSKVMNTIDLLIFIYYACEVKRFFNLTIIQCNDNKEIVWFRKLVCNWHSVAVDTIESPYYSSGNAFFNTY